MKLIRTDKPLTEYYAIELAEALLSEDYLSTILTSRIVYIKSQHGVEVSISRRSLMFSIDRNIQNVGSNAINYTNKALELGLLKIEQ